ncbi:hypothetical protein GOP47_0008834 [Adiantum capillus-veneris]|uniref:RING-type domain-containing protein n=1 Tax=Adiantum capillus-veneris TaxID=13818 RepID=A0A9D4UZD7_ADICA|nr:hypothetical protein GOP47_0008834 [Adiantum capillus-veneris]
MADPSILVEWQESEDSIDATEAIQSPAIIESQQEICSREFGFNLKDLLEKLNDVKKQSMDLEVNISYLARRHANDPTTDVRDYGSFFMQEMLAISRLASDNITNAFISMHCTLLKNMQAEIEELRRELASSKAALESLEMEKEGLAEAAQRQHESDKALLEASLRDELQTCQICHENPRNAVILPCFHGQYCGDCLHEYQKNNQACPTCRGVIRVFAEASAEVCMFTLHDETQDGHSYHLASETAVIISNICAHGRCIGIFCTNAIA